MRRLLFHCFLFVLTVCPAGLSGEDRAVLLHWNDLHGQVLPRVRSDGSREGGVRAMARLVAETRAREGKDRVLVLDAGDWFQGTPEGNFSRGRMIIDLFNALRVDVAVVGNHDYDAGEPNLIELCQRARFPVLGANVVDDEGAIRPYLEATAILEAGGIRFGVIGLLSPRTPEIVIQEIGRDLRVADAIETCRRLVPEVRRRGAQCVVVLSHLGVGLERRLAAEVPGIDLVVGGHSHTPIFEPWRSELGAVGTQAGCKGKYIGRIEVRRSEKGDLTFDGRLVPVVEAEGERGAAEIERILAASRTRIETVMGEVVGEQKESLRPGSRRGANRSSPLGNWLCDVMARKGRTSIALHNRGGIRDTIDIGPVTVRTLFQVSPFGNEVVVCKMTGADLRSVLARAVRESEVRLEVSGLRVHWREAGDGPELVSIEEMSGQAIADDRIYRVTTNSYLAGGGDGWAEFKRHSEPVSLGIGVFEASVEEYRRVGTVKPPREQRFVLTESF